MIIEVYGRKTSLNVQKALWALEEVGRPYQRKDYGGQFGKTDTPEFLAMNPHGLIPVYKDKKHTIWESNTIVRHVLSSFARKRHIMPVTPVAEQWMDWSSLHLVPALFDVFMKTVRTAPKLQDRDAINQAAEKLNAQMAKLDTWLADKDYMLGQKLSAADFAIGSNLYRYYAMDFERPAFKNLRSYFDRLLDRPAFVRTIVTSFEPLRVRDEDVPDEVDGVKAIEPKTVVTADQAKEMAAQALGAAKEKAAEAATVAKEQASKAFVGAMNWLESRKKKDD